MSKEKIVGIIGGMGPAATIDLMQRILRNTPALDDADHIRCVIDQNTKVPSRIQNILYGGGENPGSAMADSARRLEAYGAEILAIACNTAHYYFPEVQKAVRVPVLNMPDLTVDEAVHALPTLRRAGVLAAPMEQRIHLYGNAFKNRGIEPLYPDERFNGELFEVIKQVKAGLGKAELAGKTARIVSHLFSKGAECCVLACTELGIVAEPGPQIFDAAEILARALVRLARNEQPWPTTQNGERP